MPILNIIHDSDIRFFNRIHNYPRRSIIQKYARYISRSADGQMYLIIGLALLVYGEIFKAQILATAFVLERLLYVCGKNGLKRNRPPHAIQNFRSVITPSDNFSLPSGHTSAASLMTVFLAFLVPITLVVSIPWALGVGVSRVILGVHFPSDIAAGALLGSSICLLTVITMT